MWSKFYYPAAKARFTFRFFSTSTLKSWDSSIKRVLVMIFDGTLWFISSVSFPTATAFIGPKTQYEGTGNSFDIYRPLWALISNESKGIKAFDSRTVDLLLTILLQFKSCFLKRWKRSMRLIRWCALFWCVYESKCVTTKGHLTPCKAIIGE